MWGASPHIFEGRPGPPGPARPQKHTPNNPARLPSGTRSSITVSLGAVNGLAASAALAVPMAASSRLLSQYSAVIVSIPLDRLISATTSRTVNTKLDLHVATSSTLQAGQ